MDALTFFILSVIAGIGFFALLQATTFQIVTAYELVSVGCYNAVYALYVISSHAGVMQTNYQ